MTAPKMLERRVLFIGTPFFGYYQRIIASFEANGYVVDHYDDRPSDNALIKGAIHVRPSAVRFLVRRHLDRILTQTKLRQYDVIFVLNGKTLTQEFVRALRDQNPQARAVLYLWDAIELYPHVLRFAPLFDRRYTFDRVDALNHPEFELLPLFYSHEYEQVAMNQATSQTFDLLNVCTAHPSRYAVMKTVLPKFSEEGIRVFSHLYLNPLRLAYNRIREPVFKGARLGDFRVWPLQLPAYLDLLRQSRAVLDVNHSAQSGLTIRTIEAIGARKKLVTTNAEVQKYAFYDPTRIHVLNPNDLDVPSLRHFLETPMKPLDTRQYETLGLDHWVAKIIDAEAVDE